MKQLLLILGFALSCARLLLILGFALSCAAQNIPFPSGALAQFFDNNGAPLSGGFIYSCVAGLSCAPGSPGPTTPPSNPQTTYQTAGGSANTNPIVLSSAGTANIWTIPGLSYQFAVYTSVSALVRTVDNVPGGSVLGQSTVTANFVLAGPTSGAAATPTFRALVAADFAGLFSGTTCTNQFISALSTSLAGTCTSPVLASAQFANQGTTTTVAHGNAAGNPSWGPSVGADFGTSIAARSSFGNPTTGAAAPAFGTTVDVLAYQVAEVPSFTWVTSDFTTAASTALQNITGLPVTIPANTALSMPFSCHLLWSQATAAVVVSLGIQDVTISPTNITAKGEMYTSASVTASGNLVGLNSTTATAIVSGTPSATGTVWNADLSGFIEAPSNASSSAIQIMVSTATAGDAVTIKRGSWCRWN